MYIYMCAFVCVVIQQFDKQEHCFISVGTGIQICYSCLLGEISEDKCMSVNSRHTDDKVQK